MTFTELSDSQFDQMSDADGEWYFSTLVPEDVKGAAQMMADNGASDAEIGKIVRHHMHDVDKENDGLEAFTVSHSSYSGSFGVVVLVPHEHWYDLLGAQLSDHGWNTKASHIRPYGVPDREEILGLVVPEIEARGLANTVLPAAFRGQFSRALEGSQHFAHDSAIDAHTVEVTE